jgi:hypothetical protein
MAEKLKFHLASKGTLCLFCGKVSQQDSEFVPFGPDVYWCEDTQRVLITKDALEDALENDGYAVVTCYACRKCARRSNVDRCL